MSGRYERVNAQDEDDFHSPVGARSPVTVPNSPPPSFHSRASSPNRRHQVNPDLADAFDDDDDDSDDEPDDRQRLVRQNSLHAASGSSTNPSASAAAAASSHTPAYAPPPPQPASSAPRSARVIGGGNGTDGVFANMSARPERTETSEKEEQPPTYEQAAADQAPPYWETTILAPGYGGIDEVYVEGMPVGSVFSFIWNGMVSASFPFVGFLLTYLLHSTHAAKNGSRAGLGVTLIQNGFYMKGTADEEVPAGGSDGYATPPDPNSHDFNKSDVTEGPGAITAHEYFSYILMIVGWFILIKSIAEFLKARRHEMLVLQSPDRGLAVPVVGEHESSERVV